MINFSSYQHFLEDLSELAMKSEEAARHADLDAGLVGHNSTFYEIGQTWIK
jgi:hypothetical protein